MPPAPSRAPEPQVPICYWIFDCTHESKKYSIFGSQNSGFPSGTEYNCFLDCDIPYFQFCDDFGPMNLAAVVEFMAALENSMTASNFDSIVYCARNGRRSLTIAAFLLGAYSMLKLGDAPTDVKRKIQTNPN